MSDFIIKVSGTNEAEFAESICQEMEISAKARGTGIAKRSVDYIRTKLAKGEAFVALHNTSLKIAGFCYIEAWDHSSYIANSGLLIFPEFRRHGLAVRLKEFAFRKSREKYPEAKLFGLTTNSSVMKINSELGYRPVTYGELTDSDSFWSGCQSCVNYCVLISKGKKNCLCTAMLFDPNKKEIKAPIIKITEESEEPS